MNIMRDDNCANWTDAEWEADTTKDFTASEYEQYLEDKDAQRRGNMKLAPIRKRRNKNSDDDLGW